MKELLKYTIFRTSWGCFGLLGTESCLCRTCLPLPDREKAQAHLLNNLSHLKRNASPAGYEESKVGQQGYRLQLDKSFFQPLQEEIAAYFDGVRVDFSPEIPLALSGLTHFARSVLAACRKVSFGQTTSYSGLAKTLGRPSGARAVGNTLARNPLPLIIPCHRVLRSDGGMGGFSAAGGPNVKRKMLELEQQAPTV
ncbi:MAG: methylated-DNA--[protein]-cysteine S-methyltransferase [Phycisphaerales bacterium]|nr:MAG: methylated-DNA--[protein]-cysteine S-methyltransferase [Phycisphaerales bacterium]